MANMVPVAPPICNQPSPLTIIHFSTCTMTLVHSFLAPCNEKFLQFLVPSSLYHPCLSCYIFFMHVAADWFTPSCNGAHCNCNCYVLQFQEFWSILCTKFASSRVTNYWTHYKHSYYHSKNQCCVSKILLQSVFKLIFGVHTTLKSVDTFP